MEPTIHKPSAYNTPGIYKGAGGIYKGRGVYNDGGKNIVEFGGIKYGFVKIGNLLWITENLKNYTSGALFYNNSEEYAELGYLYPRTAIIKTTDTQSDFILSLIHDGWRVPTKSDFESLLNIPIEELKTKYGWPTPGNNKSGFNGYLSGYRGWGGGWGFDASPFFSQTVIYGGIGYSAGINDDSFVITSDPVDCLVNEGKRLRAVRLCKDV